MKKVSMFIALLSIVFLFSCSKDQQEIVSDPQVDLNQRELLSKMKEASLVIAQFSENEEVKKELDRMIKLKMYNDDFVFFKDLFTPSSNEKLKSANIETTAFEKAFDNANANSGLKSKEIDDLKDYLIANNLVLYIPYPEEMYPEDKRIPTISYHPIVNDSISEGFQPVIKNDKVREYKTVIVNYAYALKNLCYLIVPAELLSYEIEKQQLKSIEAPTSGQHYEVRIGKAMCYRHYDGLFGGGSEIIFGIVTGDINLTNGQVTAVPKGFMKTIPRLSIDLGYHVDINTMYLADWTPSLTQVSVFIFEDDPEGTREASGSVKTTASTKLSGNGTAGNSSSTGTAPNVTAETTGTGYTGEVNGGFEYQASWKTTVKTQDAIIMHQDYPRDYIFAINNDENAEWGKWSNEYNVIYRGVKNEFAFCLIINERTY